VGIICCNLPAISALVQYYRTQKKPLPLAIPAPNDHYNKGPFRSIISVINEDGERVERESIFSVNSLPAVLTGPKKGMFGLNILRPFSRAKLRSKKAKPNMPEPWEVRSGHIHDRTQVTITSLHSFPEPPPRQARKLSITEMRSRGKSRSRDRRKPRDALYQESREMDEKSERRTEAEMQMEELRIQNKPGILITRDVAVDRNEITTIPEDRQMGSQEKLFHEKPR
jgi:hypothetical protein